MKSRTIRESALTAFRPGPDGPFDFARANRLVSRAGFGGTREEIAAVAAQGLDGAIERLWNGNLSEDGSEIASSSAEAGAANARAWWIDRMLRGNCALRERLTLLWHGHFATSIEQVRDTALLLRQNEMLRWRCAGGFPRLLHDVVVDPAMIVYLDGAQNHKSKPNENLARELLELFALGHGNYSQSDVRELARALTGWQVRLQEARFVADGHDDGPKRILGRLDTFDTNRAVAWISSAPRCARHISSILWSHFVGGPCDEALLCELSDSFRADGMHVGRFVERILRSRAFLAPSGFVPRTPSPVELVVVMSRRLGLRPDPHLLVGAAARMGQLLFAPPSVAGWPSDARWLSTTWCLRRLELPFVIAERERGTLDAAVLADPGAWVQSLFCANDVATEAIAAAAKRLAVQPPNRALLQLLSLPEAQWI